MSHKPDFSLEDFKLALVAWFRCNLPASKHANNIELANDYSIPFGLWMLEKLKSYSNVDSRWFHEGYGLVFKRNDLDGWEVQLNELALEFIESSRQTRSLG